MGAARGRRNVKRKRKATTGSSSEASDHVDDHDRTKKNCKNHQLPATMKPAAAAEAEAAQPAGAAGKKKTEQEKRKRVVRDRLPEDLIIMMIVDPYYVHEIPDEVLARLSGESRASYAEMKARTEKWVADDQALIDQYLISGYAETVSEVTDDEDDGNGDDTVEEEIVDIIN